MTFEKKIQWSGSCELHVYMGEEQKEEQLQRPWSGGLLMFKEQQTTELPSARINASEI